jgi:hypothetical protein
MKTKFSGLFLVHNKEKGTFIISTLTRHDQRSPISLARHWYLDHTTLPGLTINLSGVY